jgi:hypothetical protein
MISKKDYRTNTCGQAAAAAAAAARNFTMVSIDKSFFFYNYLVRHFWIDKDL